MSAVMTMAKATKNAASGSIFLIILGVGGTVMLGVFAGVTGNSGELF
jgi:hypothetical protein